MRPRNRTATGRIVMRPRPLGNTPIGTRVIVTPVDPRTGSTPVTITFDEVLVTGITSVASSAAGPAPPDGFRVSGEYCELITTAEFRGAEVCLRHEAAVAPTIARFEDGRWAAL